MLRKKTIMLAGAVVLVVLGMGLCSCTQSNTNQSSDNSNIPANVNTKNDNVNGSTGGRGTFDTETHEITKVSYSFNYAEVGDGWSYELIRGEGNEDTLLLTKISYEKSDPNEFSISHADLAEIESICESGGVYDWPEKLDKPDMMWADRSEKHVIVEYSDGQVRRFSTDDALPDGGDEVISKIGRIMSDMVDID